MVYLYSLSFLIFIFIVWPIAVAFGWYRWTQNEYEKSLLPTLSFTGHLFATVSLLLAVASVFVADKIGGFRYWDPTLLKIFRAGFILSLVSLILAIAGAWKVSPLRWSAPVSAFGAMLFWIASALAE